MKRIITSPSGLRFDDVVYAVYQDRRIVQRPFETLAFTEGEVIITLKKLKGFSVECISFEGDKTCTVNEDVCYFLMEQEAMQYRKRVIHAQIKTLENELKEIGKISDKPEVINNDKSGIKLLDALKFAEKEIDFSVRFYNLVSFITYNNESITLDELDSKTFLSYRNAGKKTLDELDKLKDRVYGRLKYSHLNPPI